MNTNNEKQENAPIPIITESEEFLTMRKTINKALFVLVNFIFECNGEDSNRYAKFIGIDEYFDNNKEWLDKLNITKEEVFIILEESCNGHGFLNKKDGLYYVSWAVDSAMIAEHNRHKLERQL